MLAYIVGPPVTSHGYRLSEDFTAIFRRKLTSSYLTKKAAFRNSSSGDL